VRGSRITRIDSALSCGSRERKAISAKAPGTVQITRHAKISSPVNGVSSFAYTDIRAKSVDALTDNAMPRPG
jgi:hypothetical protein